MTYPGRNQGISRPFEKCLQKLIYYVYYTALGENILRQRV